MYIAIGIILVLAFTVVILYYYSPKNKQDVEAAKYEMLRDDDLVDDDVDKPEQK
jgi:cbb3-type cytochrome oxidase subunit 3